MKNSKFGPKQLWKDTPLIIKQIRLGILTFIGSGMMYMPTLARWTGIAEKDIIEIFGVVLLVMTAILHMFGVKPDEQIKSETTARKRGTNPAAIVGGRPDDKEPKK